MSQATALAPYRPGQGVYARATAAAAMLSLVLYASVQLFRFVKARSTAALAFKLLGMNVPHAALWAAGLFVVLGAVIFLFTFGLQTGLKALDRKTHGLIDLLIDTESELAKVSWPGPDELRRSTVAVLISIALLGGLLFCIDMLVGLVMRVLKVL